MPTDPLASSQILLNAAAWFEQGGGWWQEPPYSWGEGPNGERCAIRAINQAAGGYTDAAEAAQHRLRQIVGDSISNWNDDPDRTKAEVIAALRTAAAQERPRHE